MRHSGIYHVMRIPAKHHAGSAVRVNQKRLSAMHHAGCMAGVNPAWFTPASYLFGKTSEKSVQATSDSVFKIGVEARTHIDTMRNVSLSEVISILHLAGEKLRDTRSPFRSEALRHLSETISFSKPVIEKSLDALCEILDERELLKRTQLELFLPYAMETPIERRGYNGLISAVPKGVVLHVGAGNVFLGIIDSLILGLLTRNVNILKLSSAGSNFATLFLALLKDCDKYGKVSGSIAALNWPGGNKKIEQSILKHCDAVFVWGGEEALLSYKKAAPANVAVTGFGPKTSVGIISESALQIRSMSELSMSAAMDTALWDQSACASPHTIYLICTAREKQKMLLKEFSGCAAEAFKKLQIKWPQGRLGPDEKVEITGARLTAEIDEAAGDSFSLSS